MSEQPAYPMPDQPRPSNRPRIALLITVLSMLVIGGTVGLIVALSGSSTMTVRGTLDRPPSAHGGYSDLNVGAQVEVVNRSGEVLAIGVLVESPEEPVYDSLGFRTMSFVFEIPDVPRGHGIYGVRIGNANRGTIYEKEPDSDVDELVFSLSLSD